MVRVQHVRDVLIASNLILYPAVEKIAESAWFRHPELPRSAGYARVASVCLQVTAGAQGEEDSTSGKRSPWAAPAAAPSLVPRRTKAMPTASTAPASGPAT